MGNKRDLDDWGTLPTRKEVESTAVVKKWVLSVLCLAIFVSLGFWYLKPTQEIKQEVKQDSKDYNDLTSKNNNYGYPDNVVIPKNVEKVLSSVEGDVNQEGSEVVKSYLEDIRSSVVETEKDWDVTKLGSRKYIDYKLPSNLEMVLLEDNSVLKLVLRHTLEMGLKDKLNDGFYLIINPLDEAQMYLKKEFYTRAEEDTTTNYLVYINDVSQYNLPEALLSKLGYGGRKKFYDVGERLKIKDYPMVVKIKDGNVVAKKTNVKNLGGF